MLKYIYLMILAFIVVLVTVNMYRKKNSIWFQIDAGLVLVTLLLRLLLIK